MRSCRTRKRIPRRPCKRCFVCQSPNHAGTAACRYSRTAGMDPMQPKGRVGSLRVGDPWAPSRPNPAFCPKYCLCSEKKVTAKTSLPGLWAAVVLGRLAAKRRAPPPPAGQSGLEAIQGRASCVGCTGHDAGHGWCRGDGPPTASCRLAPRAESPATDSTAGLSAKAATCSRIRRRRHLALTRLPAPGSFQQTERTDASWEGTPDASSRIRRVWHDRGLPIACSLHVLADKKNFYFYQIIPFFIYSLITIIVSNNNNY